MADISHIKIKNTTYDIRDKRISAMSNQNTTYLDGNGQWTVPSIRSGVRFVDEDNHLLVILPE